MARFLRFRVSDDDRVLSAIDFDFSVSPQSGRGRLVLRFVIRRLTRFARGDLEGNNSRKITIGEADENFLARKIQARQHRPGNCCVVIDP